MKYKLLIVDDNIGLANNISIFINKNISNLIEIIGIANNRKDKRIQYNDYDNYR